MGKQNLPLSNQYTLTKKFVGYGHYELTVTSTDGQRFTTLVGDMDLITRLNSEVDKEREKATAEAIALVCNSL